MKKYLLIYHEEDNDGVFSGAIFYDYLINKLKVSKEDIKLLPANYAYLAKYAEAVDLETIQNEYDSIIMTDISFNDASFMKELYNIFGTNFIWCDHHAPIIKESEKLNFSNCPGIRNTSKSAILCAYEYLYDQFNDVYNTINKEPNSKFPELFRVLSGWDSWSYEREGYTNAYVRNVNKGVTCTFNLDFNKILEKVHETIKVYTENSHFYDNIKELDFIQNMHDLGKMLNDYEDQIMTDIIKTSGDTNWKVELFDEDKGRYLYLRACAIFHQGASNSLMFQCLKKKGIEIGLVFKHSPSGNWVMSMYNVNEDHWFHCGEFLKERYNGGGHKGAAGCTLSEEQFIEILKNRKL